MAEPLQIETMQIALPLTYVNGSSKLRLHKRRTFFIECPTPHPITLGICSNHLWLRNARHALASKSENLDYCYLLFLIGRRAYGVTEITGGLIF